MALRIVYIHSENLLQQADRNPAVKGRATLTHQLIESYDLLRHMKLLPARVCNISDLRGFHTRDYMEKFQRANCHKTDELEQKGKTHALDSAEEEEEEEECDVEISLAEEYGLGFDCPLWHGMSDYLYAIAGATMTACDYLCKCPPIVSPLLINWTGGWHHAHRDKAGGYCYINDIVLGILVLRKRFQRVLYIDLDVHHGDGVQEAFETTKRVFTLSFHQYEAGFYPGTGSAADCGFGGGRGYAANFPYRSGLAGQKFRKYFKRITATILERYQPDACVVQCGADVIAGDPLGGTNLTPLDLIECVQIVLRRRLPTLLLGGGGYHFCNSSRYWTQLTAAVCGQTLADDIPEKCESFLAYGPDYRLQVEAPKFRKDLNTDEELEASACAVEANLEKHHVRAV